MLALTRKTDYALIALSYLAERYGEGGQPVSAKQIAEAFGLPLPLLMNILKELAQARLVTSTRGAQGGYDLAVDPQRLTLLEVVTALEGPVRLSQCADGLPVVGQGCQLSGGCPIRGTIRSLHRRINRFLSEVTLRDLCDERLDAALDSDTHTPHGCGCGATTNHPAHAGTTGSAELYQGA
jgi:Rrf2 family protein